MNQTIVASYNILLVGFRIFNYKVIIDTGFCRLNEGITSLIGKNESGKTIILEALKYFNQNTNIAEDYQKEYIHTDNPKLSLVFAFPPKIINAIFDKHGIDYHVYHSLEIEVSKLLTPNYSPSIALYEINQNQLKEWGVNSSDNSKRVALIKSILEAIPILFFFKAEDELFPDIIKLSQVGTNPFINYLRRCSNLDALLNNFKGKLVEPDKKNQINKKNSYLIKERFTSPHTIENYQKLDISKVETITDFYSDIFNQFYFSVDQENLYFGIKQQNQIFPLTKINRLDHWYFTFYLILFNIFNANTAKSVKVSSPILLLDEPGVLIHSRSQKLLAGKLENLSFKTQIILTTHSPYLLSADKINEIRIVEKNPVNGTQFIEQINGVSDAETLSPLLTAIGMELSFTINQAERRRNIIVEGVSDLYYMEGFKNLLNIVNINIIYGGGAGNMAKIGTILRGWGCDILYLYDNDKGGTDAEKNLKKYWLFDKSDILFVLEQEGTIEDLFEPDDFREIALDDATKSYKGKNSDFIREYKINKVACALKFKQYVEKKKPSSLRAISMQNINRLFESALKHFEELERKQLRELSKITKK